MKFAGRLPVLGLVRLRDALLDPSGEVEFRLAFGRDEDDRAVIIGEVQAILALRCQRCLGALMHEVNARVAIALVGGMDEARELPERYDPLLQTDASIRLADLVEDELLLSLPQIPMHDPGLCQAADANPASEAKADRESPFAVLSAWRGKQ